MAFVGRAATPVAAMALTALASGVLVVSQHQACAAANYPDKAVRIVLPFAAGGVADITARIIAEDVKRKLVGLGIEAKASTPQEISARLRSDIDKWHEVIEKAGIQRQ